MKSITRKATIIMQKLKLSAMTGKLAGITGINTSSLDNVFCRAMSLKKIAM
jgi:hypothetical protein